MDGEKAVNIFAEGASVLQGRRSLKDMRGVSDEAISSIYGVAHELYSGGKYAEAMKGFELLCLYDHENPKYWAGLGYCRQMLKDYMGAATALSYSTLYLDDHDWELYLNMALCLAILGQKDSAREYADIILASPDAGIDTKNEARSLQARLSASISSEGNLDE